MEQNKEQHGVQTLTLTKNPDNYDVIFLNDNFTNSHHNSGCNGPVMVTIHKKGSCVVGTYILDIAQSKQQKAIEMAQKAGFPLRIKIQPHKD